MVALYVPTSSPEMFTVRRAVSCSPVDEPLAEPSVSHSASSTSFTDHSSVRPPEFDIRKNCPAGLGLP